MQIEAINTAGALAREVGWDVRGFLHSK